MDGSDSQEFSSFRRLTGRCKPVFACGVVAAKVLLVCDGLVSAPERFVEVFGNEPVSVEGNSSLVVFKANSRSEGKGEHVK